MAIYIIYFGNICGFLVAILLPAFVKHSHVKMQNGLLENCRSLYLLAVKALDMGERDRARENLKQIRRIEKRWRLGNSWLARIAKMISGICLAILLSLFLRFGSIALSSIIEGSDPLSGSPFDDWSLPIFFSISATVHAMISYQTAWTDPWVIDDTGDRLQRLLEASHDIVLAKKNRSKKKRRSVGSLSPREIFGLGPAFTRIQLSQSRRRLVAKLHPDRWHDASPSDRLAREEVLKRVNAAYDELRAQAS